jgi:hypothetical protein
MVFNMGTEADNEEVVRLGHKWVHSHRRGVPYQKINDGTYGTGYVRLRRATEGCFTFNEGS